jgi:O-antigen/teichoic acid export membrane protein
MSTQKAFVKDIVRYLPSQLLPALTAFITTPILTRLFAPVEYGQWALASGVSEFFLALATSSLGAAAIRYYPFYNARAETGVFFAVLGTSVGIVIAAVSAVSLFALYLLRGRLPAALYPLLLITIPIFIVQAVFTALLSVVRAQQRSGLYTTFQLLFRYGSLGLGLLLVLVFGLRVEGLLWGTFLTLVLALPFLLLSATRGIRIRSHHFRPQDALQIGRYAWPLALGNVAMWGLRLSDRYIISSFRPGSEVGLYSVAYSISGKSIDIIVSLFLLSVSPLLMSAWESQGREVTEKAMAMVTRLYLILCLPAAVGLSVLASPFITLLAAEPYREGYRIVGYVAFSSLVMGLATIATMGVMVKKKALRLGINQVVAASINLVLNLILVPRFGFVAAGITTLVGYTALLVLQTYTSRPYLTWRFPFRTLRNVVIAAICMGLVAWGIYGFSGNRSEAHVVFLLLSIVGAVPVYFACLWWLGEANARERTAVRCLWHRIAGNARAAVRCGNRGPDSMLGSRRENATACEQEPGQKEDLR